MMLQTIRLHPFGRFADESRDVQRPLVVVHGPNELGKTTLQQAIFHVLFTPTKLTKTRLNDTVGPWLPRPAGDHAAVTLTFEHGGTTWTLEKRWGGSPSSRLSDGTTSFADPDAVQKRLAEMLGHSEATFRHVLFTGQAELESTLHAIDTNSDDLRDIGELLRAGGGHEADVDEQRLRRGLDARIKSAFGRWNDERGRPEPQNGQEKGVANRWINGVGEILKAWYAWQELVAEHDELLALEQAIDRLNGEVAAIERTIATAADLVQRFGGLRDGVTARGELGERARRLAAEEAAMAAAFVGWPRAEATIDEWERQKADLEPLVNALHEELGNARMRDEAAAARQAFADIEAAKRACTQATADLGRHPDPGKERLVAVERLEKAITTAENKLASRTLAWHIEAEQTGTVSMEGGIDPVSTVTVGPQAVHGTAEARVRVVAGGITLTVESGGDDVGMLFDSLARDRESLATHLRACDAKTVSDARIKADRHREATNEADKRKGVYESLLRGKPFEQWAAEIKAIDDLPHARDIATVERAIADARQKLAAGDAKAATLLQAIDGWKATHTDPATLGENLITVRSELKQANDTLASLPELPEGFASPQAFIAAIDAAQASRLGGQQQLTDKKAEVAGLAGRMGDRRSEDVAEQAEARKRHFERVRMQGRCYLQIRDEFERIVAEREGDPLQGYGNRVAEIFARITGGGATLEFDGQLPATVVRGPVALPPERLSHGGGGALALAVRLAMAEAYLANGGGFLMLDDPLVHFDATRMAIAADILREFSDRAQVIVFTCHDHHAARLLGGSPATAPGDSASAASSAARPGPSPGESAS